ncbi:MAG: alpha-galactosidase [Defluviitaleaceae bacterium]|nr:alpha-galactosidase [Defluviitaleaceae bacterium]
MSRKNYAGYEADMSLTTGFLFTQKPELIPLSYNYKGVRYTGLPANASREEKKLGNVRKTTYKAELADAVNLQVECTTYSAYPVMEWTCFFTNTGAGNTGIFEAITPLDTVFQGRNPVVKTNTGDFHSVEGFIDTLHTLAPGIKVRSVPGDGRSCNGAWPYEKLMFDDFGINIAIGWSGTWCSEYVGTNTWAHTTIGQHRCRTYLMPGETYRTPTITLMFYKGDEDHGVNVWRKWYYDHILIKENGLPLKGKTVFAEHGGGEEFTKADEANQLESLELLKTHNIEANLWWIDAGWYDLEVDPTTYTQERPPHYGSWTNTGTWRHDEKRFPRGLKPIGEKCAEMGLDFLMWFEPLRVRRGTELEKSHPEWMMTTTRGYGQRESLLDITNPDCLKWLCEHVDGLIKEYKLKWYREDFNFPPISYWHQAEHCDRQGMVENLHIQAFYKYWDYLKEHNPGLLMDSCASGGRRNDLETMRRAVPLHHTDFGYGYKPVCQAFSYAMSRWLPYYKSSLNVWDDGDGSYPPWPAPEAIVHELDSYAFFNNIGPMMALWSPKSLDENPEILQFIKNTVIPAWKKASPIMLQGDFYSLTEPHRDSHRWTVHQFHMPDEDYGMFKVMRNQQCEIESCHVWPKAFSSEKTYAFTNAETGEVFKKTGKEIIENGLVFSQPIRSAEVWFY